MTLVQAQDRTYSGTVKDGDGQPVIGANVAIVGTTQGTSTGVDGKYSIRARAGQRLNFSFLGMKPITVTLGNALVIDVTLESDATALEDVVVVAYGTARKKDLTGSLTTIDSEVITRQSNSTLTKALEGAAPGVQISSVDGQPGVDMGVRIRGIGTASQNNANALIIIDGVPTTNSNALTTVNPKDVESMTILKDAASTALYGSRGANGVIVVTTKKGKQGKARVTFEGRWGMNMMGSNGDPNLIRSQDDYYEYHWKSIYNSVRYGSTEKFTTNAQAPNMTHEQAAEFASQHLFNYQGNVKDAQGNYVFASPGNSGLTNWMYYKVPNAVYTSTGSGNYKSATMTGAYLVNTNGKINPQAQKLYDVDDWEDLVFQNSFRQEYTVSVSGASETSDYYISAGYLEDPSYMKNAIYNRYNIRSNVNAQATKWLRVGANMSYNRSAMQQPAYRYGRNSGTVAQNLFYWINGYSPMASMYQRNEEGKMMYDEKTGAKIVVDRAGQQYSPLGVVWPKILSTSTAKYDLLYQMEHDKDMTIVHNLQMVGYVQAKFLKDFTFNANMSVDESFTSRNRYLNKAHGAAVTDIGVYGRATSEYLNINTVQTLGWVKDYGKHHVDALAGHEYNWNQGLSLNHKAAYSLIDDFKGSGNFISPNAGGTLPGSGWGTSLQSLEGYFLRANYIFDNKYYFTGSVRADGSSKFKSMAERWGVFWSLGAAWRISNESWMQNITWINDLKLRADYGVIGNQNGIGLYSGYQTWSYGARERITVGSPAPTGWTLTQGGFPNDALTWEKKNTIDAGLDFRLWDRFYGTIDWYQTNTTDMIWNAPISYAMAGQATLAQNTAEMRNRGIEFELGVDIIKNDDFLWSFSVNGAHYEATLTSVPPGTGVEKLNGCWEAAGDDWSAAGDGNTAGNTSYLRGIGKPYYNMYVFKYGGVDKYTGLPLFASTVSSDNITALQGVKTRFDSWVAAGANAKGVPALYGDVVEGNVVYTTNHSLATRQEFGDATPDFIGGFSTNFRWKNLDFSAQFAFQLGGKFLSVSHSNWYYRSEQVTERPGSAELLGNTFMPANATGLANTGAKFPMQIFKNPNGDVYTNGATIGSWMYSDMSLFSASYLSVKNITLGYNFPQKWMDRIGIGGIRAYASLDNFWMFCKDGIDPRMSLTGGMTVGAMTYPYARTCSLGLNVTF